MVGTLKLRLSELVWRTCTASIISSLVRSAPIEFASCLPLPWYADIPNPETKHREDRHANYGGEHFAKAYIILTAVLLHGAGPTVI